MKPRGTGIVYEQVGIYEPEHYKKSYKKIVAIGHRGKEEDKLREAYLRRVINTNDEHLRTIGIRRPSKVRSLLEDFRKHRKPIDVYDMGTNPLKGDALDHLEGAGLVITFHIVFLYLYSSTGIDTGVMYNRNNVDLLELRHKYGFLLISLGEHPA